jgi:hypothetical protein
MGGMVCLLRMRALVGQGCAVRHRRQVTFGTIAPHREAVEVSTGVRWVSRVAL